MESPERTKIGRRVLAGMDVKDAAAAAAEDWPATSVYAMGAFVTMVGAKWAADLLATEVRR